MVSNGDDDAAMGQATAAFFPPARRQITVNRRPAVRYSLIGFEVYGPSLSPSYSSLCFFSLSQDDDRLDERHACRLL